MASNTLTGLANHLIQHKLISQEDAEETDRKARESSQDFASVLVASGILGALDLAEFAAHTFGFPLVDLDAIDPELMPRGTEQVAPRVMQEHRIVGLYLRGNRLSVGVADPSNLAAIDAVKFQTSKVIDPVVVEADKLNRMILRLVDASDNTLGDTGDEDADLDIVAGEDIDKERDKADDGGVDDAPVVKFIQKTLLDAIAQGASDIHFEPYEKYYRIRFRRDGQLLEYKKPPIALKEKLASRIKVISKLDIAEKRVPQDGRMKINISKTRSIDFRVSTLPTLWGEKIVLRILDPSSATLGIDALGYDPDQKQILLDAIHRPYGMILVTGPTGSGKTVSLYTCLNILNTGDTNISTAEDPAEINLAGINQVNVNEKAGLTFAAALKAFLRQDPDIVMVGEIRDLETADIAIKAAQTGHMVLSTLHTNDAPTTLTRMLNMGIAPFNIASSVILITAQRLARRLCKCKQPVELPREALLRAGFAEADIDGSWQPMGPVGCELCSGSGYKGRVGIYQVMPITDEMSRLIMKNGTAHDIADQARRDGVRDLRQSGLVKVRAGLTSLEEVEAVTNE